MVRGALTIRAARALAKIIELRDLVLGGVISLAL
jgi:hypothetical protein